MIEARRLARVFIHPGDHGTSADRSQWFARQPRGFESRRYNSKHSIHIREPKAEYAYTSPLCKRLVHFSLYRKKGKTKSQASGAALRLASCGGGWRGLSSLSRRPVTAEICRTHKLAVIDRRYSVLDLPHANTSCNVFNV